MHITRKAAPALGLLSLAALGLAAARPAAAQTTVFTDFGPGNTFDTGGSYLEAGPSGTYGFASAGAAFTVSQTGALSSLTVAYSHLDGTNVGHLYLTDSFANGAFGPALEGFTLTALPAFGTAFTPEVLTSALHPTLTAGTTYYLYGLETGNTDDGFNYNSTGAIGTVVSSDGGAYTADPDILPAFSVQVTPAAAAVPEPSQAATLGLGALGVAGLLVRARRRPLPTAA